MRGVVLTLVLLAGAQVARAQPVYPVHRAGGAIECAPLRCTPDGRGVLVGDGCFDALGGTCVTEAALPGVAYCHMAGGPTCCNTPSDCEAGGECAPLPDMAGTYVGLCNHHLCGARDAMTVKACVTPPPGTPTRDVSFWVAGDCDRDGVPNGYDSCPCMSADTVDGCPEVTPALDSGTTNVPIDLRGRGGCECRAGGSLGSGPWWLLGLGLLWLARRRRSAG